MIIIKNNNMRPALRFITEVFRYDFMKGIFFFFF